MNWNIVELNPYHPRPYVFTEAARCLRHSIEAAGYPCAVHQSVVPPEGVSVVFGLFPEHPLVEMLDPRRTLLFNLEQLGSSSSLVSEKYLQLLGRYGGFDYNSSNLSVRHAMGMDMPAFELPLLPCLPVLPSPVVCEKTTDILFFGSINPRRSALLDQLESAGCCVERIAGAYGSELTPALQRRKLVLNLHFYETALFGPLRCLQPVEQGVPIVNETSVFSRWNDWSKSGMVFADYTDLSDACLALLALSTQERLTRATSASAFCTTVDFPAAFGLALKNLSQHINF